MHGKNLKVFILKAIREPNSVRKREQIMGNIPLQGGSSAVDEIDKSLKKVRYFISIFILFDFRIKTWPM